MKPDLPARDLALIGFVVLAWGSNFSAMKIALEELPPALFVGLRFAILVPLIAVLPRPQAPVWAIFAVGALINTGQFVFLFSAMRADVTAGLASLLLQAQAPLTILLSVAVFGENVRARQLAGIALAAGGMVLIGFGGGGNITPLGLALVLAGALSWAAGNLVLKTLPNVAMLPIFIWASLVPPLPMLALSLATETNTPLVAIASLSVAGWAAVCYVAVISTVLGYSLWGALLARHPAATITPFALLIPVVGIAVAAIVLGEGLSRSEAIGAVIVLIGLAITVLRRSET
ncbi:MAG: EamA family transporter [Pseudomonadota bacterium]